LTDFQPCEIRLVDFGDRIHLVEIADRDHSVIADPLARAGVNPQHSRGTRRTNLGQSLIGFGLLQGRAGFVDLPFRHRDVGPLGVRHRRIRNWRTTGFSKINVFVRQF
jgi:hypothetical protein